MILRKISIALIATFFVIAGVAHFASPATYLPLMPGYLPWHLPLIYISGLAEIAGGIGICFKRTRRIAGWGLIALLVAVFPSNVHMLMNQVPINGKQVPEWIFWIRLPLQGVLMAWIYSCCVMQNRVRNR
jgi:uncharacterized membrane protein